MELKNLTIGEKHIIFGRLLKQINSSEPMRKEYEAQVTQTMPLDKQIDIVLEILHTDIGQQKSGTTENRAKDGQNLEGSFLFYSEVYGSKKRVLKRLKAQGMHILHADNIYTAMYIIKNNRIDCLVIDTLEKSPSWIQYITGLFRRLLPDHIFLVLEKKKTAEKGNTLSVQPQQFENCIIRIMGSLEKDES
ncbi:MAG: hypothetical protein ACLFR1_07870 [Spirochaetia bacterium]